MNKNIVGKTEFTNLLVKCFKNLSIVKKLWNKLLKKELAVKKKKKKMKAILEKLLNTKYSEREVGVRDHCHMASKFRDSSHHICNFYCRWTQKIPVISYKSWEIL